MTLAIVMASLLAGSAGSVGLIESTHSTDSVVRGRAAYALARTHARDDGTAVARVDLVLTTGATDLRVEIVRGLTSRGWHPAIPSDVEEKLVKLLGDPDLAVRLAVVDGMRHLPRPRAGDLLLAEEPRAERRGPGGAQVRARILQVGMEIGDDRFRALLARELHLRTESLAWRRDCSLDRCLEELTAMAWLGEDVSFATTRGADWRPSDPLDAMRLLRMAASGGQSAAVAQLASDGRGAMTTDDRRRILSWLIALPPTLRADLQAPLAGFARDPDPVVRERALRVLSANTGRMRGADDALATALGDGNPDARLEAAVGLFDMKVGASSAAARALARALATEPDPAVKAAIEAALASTY